MTMRDMNPRVLVELPCYQCVRRDGTIVETFQFSCPVCDGSRHSQAKIGLPELKRLLDTA